MLRPRPARWFEILAARDDATLVLEALARTSAVELEARSSAGLPAALADVLPLLAQYLDLAARYRAYWPLADACRPSAFPEAPVAALQRSLAAIRAWAQESEPVILAVQRCESEREELRLWEPLLDALGQRALDPAVLADAGPWLRVRLFVLPPGSEAEPAPQGGAGRLETLACKLEVGGATHLLVAGPPQALQAMAQVVTTQKGSAHPVPTWLEADTARNHGHVERRLRELEREMAELGATLALQHRRHDLSRALGDANRLQWVLQNVHALEAGELLCWITGWSSDPQVRTVARALQECGARALPHFAAPPAGSRGAAAPEQPALGPAVRDLQPRLRHAVFERSGSERLAGGRRTADVRLHVRRCRPGPGARRRGLVVAQAVRRGAPAHGGRLVGGRVRLPVRQRLRPARARAGVVAAPLRRAADLAAGAARRRRLAADPGPRPAMPSRPGGAARCAAGCSRMRR